MLWVASKALGISPFSPDFETLSEAQVTWAIANYYKDQEEDIEKYKLLCRFINPEAAANIWDKKPVSDTVQEEENDAVWKEILSHSKSGLSVSELKKRINNPDDYVEPDENLDKIEVVR